MEFLSNEAGEREGLGDPGIEFFRNAPYASIAREAGQNSRDAAQTLPVSLSFDVLRLPASEFPSFNELSAALKACANAAEQEKEHEFFQNALRVVGQDQIRVLQISDANTTGLTGPPGVQDTPFHSLLKSSGVSTKEKDTAGGSFGIGKNAAFAVSDLQLVLYSTVYADPTNQSERFAAQGKVKLVSHLDAAGNSRRATGYWGNPGFTAIEDPARAPSWMRRERRGTSIFAIGFRESDHWAEEMTCSIVSNFFCAVASNEMVFEVDASRFNINANTIEGFFSSSEILAAADMSSQRQEMDFAAQLYRCLVSPNAEETLEEIPGLGKVRIRVLTEPGLSKRIGFIRNGMYIADSLRHFGHPLSKFPGSRDFVAIVEPADEESSRLMKRLESPAHDNFSAQRISDPAKRASAEAALKKLGKLLRELIKKTTGVEEQQSVTIDELSRFFASGVTPTPPLGVGGERDPERYTYSPPRLRRHRRTTPERSGGSDGGKAGTGKSGSKAGGGGSGTGKGDGSGGKGAQGRRASIKLGDPRNILLKEPPKSGLWRRIFLTPDVSGPMELIFHATGIDAPEALKVDQCSVGETSEGKLVVNAVQGERIQLDVSFSEEYTGPLEISAATVGGETNP